MQTTIAIGSGSAPLYADAGYGSVWVSAYRGEFIVRIDPHTNKVVASIPLPTIGGLPVGSGRLVVGPRGVWLPIAQSSAAGENNQPNELLRIDPSTNKIALRVTVDSLYGVVDGPDGLWGGIAPSARAPRSAIIELDPKTGATLRKIDPGAPEASQNHQPEIDDGLGSLWVVVGDDRIARVDPSSGAVLAMIHTPSIPNNRAVTIAFAAHHVFISEADNTLARVDPGTDCVDGVLNVGGSQITVFAGQDGLYVGFDLGAFALIDPATLTVRRSVRVSTSAATPLVMDYIGAPVDAFGSIWDPTCSRDTVLRMELLA